MHCYAFTNHFACAGYLTVYFIKLQISQHVSFYVQLLAMRWQRIRLLCEFTFDCNGNLASKWDVMCRFNVSYFSF